MKTIGMINFLRGGKSSLSRLIGMESGLDCPVLSLDPYRKMENYNEGICETLDLPIDYKMVNHPHHIELTFDNKTVEIESESDYVIFDYGGNVKENLNIVQENNIFFLPFTYDRESISETVKCSLWLEETFKKPKIIHILNHSMCRSGKDKEKFVKDYKFVMEENGIFVPYLEMNYSSFYRNIVNEGMNQQELEDTMKTLKHSYKPVYDFRKKLIKLIEKEC